MVERRQNTRRETDMIANKLEEIEAILTEHLREADTRFAIVERAFPDGVDAHRAAHEAMISASKAQEKFWADLRLDMAKGGVRAVILVVIGLIVAGLSAKIIAVVTAIATTVAGGARP